MTKPISLTHELLRELINYDPVTGGMFWRERASKHFPHDHQAQRWNTMYVGQLAGSLRQEKGQTVNRIKVCGKTYAGGRLAWFYATGQWPRGRIKHVDGDVDNTALSNLASDNPADVSFW